MITTTPFITPEKYKPIEIPFQVEGRAMLTYGRINDAIDLKFEVDSGASDVLIPLADFQRLRQSGSIGAT